MKRRTAVRSRVFAEWPNWTFREEKRPDQRRGQTVPCRRISLPRPRGRAYSYDMAGAKNIREVARRIGETIGAERVILFGSHAKGHAADDSDVDLLIIAESDLPRHKRSRDLYKLFQPHPFAMDLIVYTPEEVARANRSEVSFVSTVLREGKTLYVRGDGDRQAMGGQGPK